MYVSFDRARYCVRRLNGTHEIGCQSATNGNSGRMYMIDDDQEFNSFLINSKTIDSFSSFIIVLNVDLFTTSYVDKLMARLDSKLNGLLLYLKSNLTRPKDFSHDDQCPNNRYSYHLNQNQTINWNPKGTGLFFRSFPFPIMLIDEENDYKQLVQFYQKFNSSASSPACGLELRTFQEAAHTTKTCIRRNDISHSLIDTQETFCDPVNGLNIYSKLPQSLTIAPNKRPEKSVILILASTDGFQMFLKTNGTTGGAQQPATALITFLALAHLVGQEQTEFNKTNKEIIFVALDGDALDYSGSFRFMFDMKNGYFPNGDQNEERIQFEHIHSVIEFQSLSFNQNLSVSKSLRTFICLLE
jgi:nicastrin